MTELLPPGELSLESAGEALADRLAVRNGGVGGFERAFYDTFDGRLYAAGLTLVHERGYLELRDRASGSVRARLAATVPPGHRLFAAELDLGPLRSAVLDLTGVRALLPLASVAGRERPLDVLDEEGKTVVRLTFDEPAGLGARLRVAGVRGYDQELAEVLATLESELGYRAAAEPLVDEAVRALGAVPGGVSSKVEVPLGYDERADRAAAAVLHRLLEVIEANLDGSAAGTDAEFLHDLRVAVRRSRSVQRELKRVFPPELDRFRREFRRLQQITGDARDLDVYELEFGAFAALVPELMRPDLEPLRAVLSKRRVAARRQMARALGAHRTVALLAAWSAFLDQTADGRGEPGAARPIGEVAGQRIRSVYHRMRRMGEAIDDSSPAADYHELRKQGKELRYLLELFGAPLYAPEVVKPMIRTLKALQDVLGRHQDREVQMAMIYSLAPEVADHPRALMAMGALVQRLGEDEFAARAEFAEPFAAFAARDQRKLVKETFR